ncbi:proline iminopeptidase-family hydrolase [Cyanobium sp. A1C-AMD]|uniref:proline iminopeptidase-family hydrolase n=2 Tax=unclassified Cyanobium TaxID=2627006 RepID=UPI0020CC597D|nr:proline iminopeptidase-family hydrolase [Cyanobium sp. A1C-AMD]
MGEDFSSTLFMTNHPAPPASGVRKIPVRTAYGTFEVWTLRSGASPSIKLLLLHGGPGCTHEYFEVFDSFLPQAGVELYFYDQLGSHHSSQPDHADLWEIERFVDEVEQVRQALALDGNNFFLLGHSWGGILAIEYALRHQQHLKGLIISNMVWSVPEYNRYAEENFLRQLPAGVLAELQAIEAAEDYDNPRYMELLIPHHYEHHVLRRPYAQWPDSVLRAFEHLNPKVYIPMQGPSELGARGKLAQWDRRADLSRIQVPTLTIGAAHDTMNPQQMAAMAKALPRGSHLHCPNGSHMAMVDDQVVYIQGLIDFLRRVDAQTIREDP